MLNHFWTFLTHLLSSGPIEICLMTKSGQTYLVIYVTLVTSGIVGKLLLMWVM